MNREIIRTLAVDEPLTNWQLTRSILLDRQRAAKKALLEQEPTYNEVRETYPTIYRRIKDLLKEGYVRPNGRVRSKGKDNLVYGLSYRGSLAALLLPEISSQQLWDTALTNSGNMILTIANQLLLDGISPGIVRILLLNGLIEDLQRGYLNIDAIEREDGDRILYARFLKRLYDKREALIKDPALLRKFSNSIKSMGFPSALINLFPELQGRLAGQLSGERVPEKKEFLSLFIYLVEGPRSKFAFGDS